MKLIMVAVVLMALLPVGYAQQDQKQVYLVNSRDWKDVYSVLEFGRTQKINSVFMTSERHIDTVLNDFNPQEVTITVFSSEDQPWVKTVAPFVDAKGYESVERVIDDMNLELAGESNATKYLIIDDVYGYNAISVAGYANVAGYYVLFANSDNIDAITDFLGQAYDNNVGFNVMKNCDGIIGVSKWALETTIPKNSAQLSSSKNHRK